ncbi:MAG: hypothetical protein WC364_04965 [Eubacteriales bacterium]|jgi:hypothetical protein
MADLTGYKWIRDLFPNVKWDAATKTATTPEGVSYNASQGIIQNGKFYLPYTTMAQGYANYTPQSAVTPDNIQSTTDLYRTMFEPQLKSRQSEVAQRQKAIEAQAESQRRTAEAAYKSGLASLTSQKENSLEQAIEQARKSAIARGVYTSGIYDELQQKERENVESAYAPGLQSLESTKAAAIANIGSESGQALDELALADKQYESQIDSYLLQQVIAALQGQDTAAKTKTQQMAEWLYNLGQQDWERGVTEAGLTGTYKGQYTPDARAAIASLTGTDPATGKATYQAATRAASGSSAAKSSGSLTTTQKTNNLADAYEAIDAALASGNTQEEIEASIRSQSASLTRSGVDPNKLITYVQTRALDYTPTEKVNPLKQRPWWQQAIDTVVPGSQYR